MQIPLFQDILVQGANVEVAVNNTREHIFTGTADSSGKYNIGMHGLSYPAGTSVRVKASLNNHSSSKTVIIYPKRVSIDTAKSGDSIILGEADPNATVHLYVHGKIINLKLMPLVILEVILTYL